MGNTTDSSWTKTFVETARIVADGTTEWSRSYILPAVPTSQGFNITNSILPNPNLVMTAENGIIGQSWSATVSCDNYDFPSFVWYFDDVLVPSVTGATFSLSATDTANLAHGIHHLTVIATKDNVVWSRAKTIRFGEQNTTTINFNSNGGSTITPRTGTYGQKFGALPIPSKDNCVFLGWYKEPEFKNKVDSDNIVLNQDQEFLYAKYLNLVSRWEFTDNATKDFRQSAPILTFQENNGGYQEDLWYDTGTGAGFGTWPMSWKLTTMSDQLYLILETWKEYKDSNNYLGRMVNNGNTYSFVPDLEPTNLPIELTASGTTFTANGINAQTYFGLSGYTNANLQAVLSGNYLTLTITNTLDSTSTVIDCFYHESGHLFKIGESLEITEEKENGITVNATLLNSFGTATLSLNTDGNINTVAYGANNHSAKYLFNNGVFYFGLQPSIVNIPLNLASQNHSSPFPSTYGFIYEKNSKKYLGLVGGQYSSRELIPLADLTEVEPGTYSSEMANFSIKKLD